MRALSIVLLVGLVGCLLSCGGTKGNLHGSICSTYDCSNDTVTIRNVSNPLDPPTTIQIDYSTGPVTGSVERAAVVVCDVSSFVQGQPLPATGCRHIAPDNIDFPQPPTRATCTFDTDVKTGENVKGTFQCVFTTEQGVERAIYGDFEGPLQATSI